MGLATQQEGLAPLVLAGGDLKETGKAPPSNGSLEQPRTGPTPPHPACPGSPYSAPAHMLTELWGFFPPLPSLRLPVPNPGGSNPQVTLCVCVGGGSLLSEFVSSSTYRRPQPLSFSPSIPSPPLANSSPPPHPTPPADHVISGADSFLAPVAGPRGARQSGHCIP